jgi:DNA-binding transcriptional ArsR family regulator
MATKALDPQLLELIAERFRALGEPARLRILDELRGGERTVTELVEATGLGQANVSKHLQYLHSLHFVERRKEGLYVFYQLAGDDVFHLCDLMCGRLEAEVEAQRRVVSGGGA